MIDYAKRMFRPWDVRRFPPFKYRHEQGNAADKTPFISECFSAMQTADPEKWKEFSEKVRMILA